MGTWQDIASGFNPAFRESYGRGMEQNIWKKKQAIQQQMMMKRLQEAAKLQQQGQMGQDTAAMQRALVAAGQLGIAEEPVMQPFAGPGAGPLPGGGLAVPGPGGGTVVGQPPPGETAEGAFGRQLPMPGGFQTGTQMKLRPTPGEAGLDQLKDIMGIKQKQAAIENMSIIAADKYAKGVAGQFGMDSDKYNEAWSQGYKQAKALFSMAIGSGMDMGKPAGKVEAAETSLEFGEEDFDLEKDAQLLLEQDESMIPFILDRIKQIDPEYAIEVQNRYNELKLQQGGTAPPISSASPSQSIMPRPSLSEGAMTGSINEALLKRWPK